MSTDEKLQKCIEFIRGIERDSFMLETRVSARDPRVSGDFQCYECGSRDIIGTTYVGLPDEIKNKAWHLLADIDGL